MKLSLPTRKPTKKEVLAAIAKEPLGEFFAEWQDAKRKDVAELARIIKSATSERPVQLYLQKKPALLIRHMGGGHGRWVIPQKRLGSEHVLDFLIGHAHSFGRLWVAVELESPTAQMFKKSGHPSGILLHGLQQIFDWRRWLTDNLDYAKRPKSDGGLGLTGIHPALAGYVIIGRRSQTPDTTNARRHQILVEHKIEVHSYDWLIDAAGGRVEWTTTETGRREHEKHLRRHINDLPEE